MAAEPASEDPEPPAHDQRSCEWSSRTRQTRAPPEEAASMRTRIRLVAFVLALVSITTACTPEEIIFSSKQPNRLATS